jgi:hypothetical protein
VNPVEGLKKKKLLSLNQHRNINIRTYQTAPAKIENRKIENRKRKKRKRIIDNRKRKIENRK